MNYIGRHAELYDLFYAEKSYKEEARFVHSCLNQFSPGGSKRLLEVACGTGGYSFEMEKLGYELVAIDNSQSMIDVAIRKATDRSSQIDFRLSDMRNLELPERTFAAAICLFDSLGYALTNAGVQSTLQSIHQHLDASGIFIADFFHAPAAASLYEPVRIMRYDGEHGQVLRLSETTLDAPEQALEIKYSIYELNSDGRYSSFDETHRNRYFSMPEMAYFLSSSGFEPLKWYGGFRKDSKVSADTFHVLSLSRKI